MIGRKGLEGGWRTPLHANANDRTALDQAISPDTRRGLLADWLRQQGAHAADAGSAGVGR